LYSNYLARSNNPDPASPSFKELLPRANDKTLYRAESFKKTTRNFIARKGLPALVQAKAPKRASFAQLARGPPPPWADQKTGGGAGCWME